MSDNGNRDAVQWGPEIAVDCKRPEWLEDDQYVDVRWGTGTWYSSDHGINGAMAQCVYWDGATFIRLPADHPHYKQAPSIDWTAPIEAVHEDGRVVPVELDPEYANPDSTGKYTLLDEPEPESYYVYNPDGTAWITDGKDGWRIRNVAQTTTRTTDEQLTHYAERCKALVERMAKHHRFFGAHSGIYDEARAIVASMVEVDGDLIAARELVACLLDDFAHADTAAMVREGRADRDNHVQRALAAIRRGRALERGE